MVYDNQQHTRRRRVSVRSRMVADAVTKVGDGVSNGMSLDASFANDVGMMGIISGMSALKVNRMANRVAAQVS